MKNAHDVVPLFNISNRKNKQRSWNLTEAKQFAKQTTGSWKTLVNIRNHLYYPESCKLCFEDKRYIWTKTYIIIGYRALSTEYSVYIRQLFDKQQLSFELILLKILKNPGWKQKLGGI